MSNAMGHDDTAKLNAMAAASQTHQVRERSGALTQQLVKLTEEAPLGAEMEAHLGYEKHDQMVEAGQHS